MRRCLIALAVLTVSLLLLVPAAAQSDNPGSRAVQYLHSLQGADGSIDPVTHEQPNPNTQSETAYAVMGAVAVGMDPTMLRSPAGYSPLDYLAAHSATATATHDAAAGPTAEVILAEVAAGQDPRHVGKANVNLVQRLETTDKTSDSRYGFGDTDAQSLGILAEVASATPVDTRAVDWLRGLQNVDGSWNQGASSGAPGDTNSTAIAVMALTAATHEVPNRAQVLAFFRADQNVDGGFPVQQTAGHDAGSHPDSDGLAIQALLALGEKPAGPQWAVLGKTPLDNMLSFQTASGGFRPPVAGSPPPPPAPPDGATTAPLPAAAALMPLPVRIFQPTPAGAPTPTARAVTRPVRPAATTAASTARPFPPTPAAAVPAPTAQAPLPVAIAIPGPTDTVVGGVRGISVQGNDPAPRPAVETPSRAAYALAGGPALALVGLAALLLRRRRGTT